MTERIASLYSPSCEGLSPIKLKSKAFSFDVNATSIKSIDGSLRKSNTRKPINSKFLNKDISIIVSKEFDEREKEIILSE
jgi:hypothetical protein